jgi:hypothetical protein
VHVFELGDEMDVGIPEMGVVDVEPGADVLVYVGAGTSGIFDFPGTI